MLRMEVSLNHHLNWNSIVILGVSKEDTFSNASSCHSPASEEAGGIYSQELLDNFGTNLHRYFY